MPGWVARTAYVPVRVNRTVTLPRLPACVAAPFTDTHACAEGVAFPASS